MIKITVQIRQLKQAVGVLIDVDSAGEITPKEMLQAKLLYDALIDASEKVQVTDPDVKQTEIIESIKQNWKDYT